MADAIAVPSHPDTMGGNAFGHESASRMTSEQLHKLERHCKEMLLGAGVFTKAQMFHYTANKATHGDLDLVVDYPDAWGPPYMRARELIYLDDVPLAEVCPVLLILGVLGQAESSRADGSVTGASKE